MAAKSYAREAAAVTQPAASIAASLSGQGSALLLPEGGQMLRTVSGALEGNGINPRSTKILGTGLWDDGLTRSTPIAQGGWYAGVAPQLVQAFEQKYVAATAPSRRASPALPMMPWPLPSIFRKPAMSRKWALQAPRASRAQTACSASARTA